MQGLIMQDSPVEALPLPGLTLRRLPRALYVRSEQPLQVLSSAVVGAELDETRHILNLGVPSDYDSRSPADDLLAAARGYGIDEPFAGLMTAARLERAQVVAEQRAGLAVAAVITVGISRPVAAGVTEAVEHAPHGTINMILIVDGRLTRAAAVNAVKTATEAKTLALVESGLRAPHGGPASGTATDSIVLAWTGRGEPIQYAGPVAPAGALLARAVRRAILGYLAE